MLFPAPSWRRTEMANQLKMATIDTIITLRQQGWSIRRIAKTLGIHRDTVARHLREANQAGALAGSDESKLGQALAGSDEGKLGQALAGSDEGKLGQALAGSAGPGPGSQPSLCEPFRAVIQAKLDQGLTAQRIYQDL